MTSRFKHYWSNGWVVIWRPCFPKYAIGRATGGWCVYTPAVAIWVRSCHWLESQRFRFQP